MSGVSLHARRGFYCGFVRLWAAAHKSMEAGFGVERVCMPRDSSRDARSARVSILFTLYTEAAAMSSSHGTMSSMPRRACPATWRLHSSKNNAKRCKQKLTSPPNFVYFRRCSTSPSRSRPRHLATRRSSRMARLLPLSPSQHRLHPSQHRLHPSQHRLHPSQQLNPWRSRQLSSQQRRMVRTGRENARAAALSSRRV